MVITIDGPSASGKSTVARAVAQQLNYFYIASGTIYRGLAYVLMHARGYTQNTIAHVQESDVIYCFDGSRFSYEYNAHKNEHIIFEGVDITYALKSPLVDSGASLIGTNPMVRAQIVQLIRALAQQHDIVIDGRDCGSIMFPSAEHKFYLTASLAVRAARWQSLQATLGKNSSLDQALQSIAMRDERDSSRAIAPLKIPDGACVIDSSDKDVQEVIRTIVRCVQKKEEA